MTDSRSVASTPRPDHRPDLQLVSLHTVRGDPHTRLAEALADLEGAAWGLLLGGDAALARQLAALLGGGTLRVDGRLRVNRDALAEAGLAVASLDADWKGARAVWLLEPDARTLERAVRAGVRVIVDATLAPGSDWPARGADLVVYRDGVTLTGHADGMLAALFGMGRAPAAAAPAPADLTVALALRDVATLPLRLARAARTTAQLAERLGGTALEAGPTALLLAPDAAADTFSAPGGVMAAARSVPAGVLLTPGLQDMNSVLALLRPDTAQPNQPSPRQGEQWNAKEESVPAPAAEDPAQDPEPLDSQHLDTAPPVAGPRDPEPREEGRRDPEQRTFGQRDSQRRNRSDGRRDDGRRGDRNSQGEPRRFERPRMDQTRPDQHRADQSRADQARPDQARPDSGAPPERFTFDAPDTEYADHTAPDAPTQTAAPAVTPAISSPVPTFPVPSPAHDEVWEPEIVFSDTPNPDALTEAVHRQSEEEASEQRETEHQAEAVQAEPEAGVSPEEETDSSSFAEALAEFEQTETGQAQLEQVQAAAPIILAPDLPPTPPAGASGTDAERPDPTADLTPEQAAIYARLRDWRNAEAKRQDMSRFIIASNATIAEIARRVPYTAADLKAVRGMGPERLRKYGEKILEVVRG